MGCPCSGDTVLVLGVEGSGSPSMPGSPRSSHPISSLPVSAQMNSIRNNAVLVEMGSLWGSRCTSPHPSSPPCGEKTPTLPWWPWRGRAKSRDHYQGNV